MIHHLLRPANRHLPRRHLHLEGHFDDDVVHRVLGDGFDSVRACELEWYRFGVASRRSEHAIAENLEYNDLLSPTVIISDECESRDVLASHSASVRR